MPTTTNFGWTTPADTDYVTNGADAIRTVANGIDTSLVDLKGGTTGQVLTKASGTDLDYSWATPPGYTLLSTTALSGTSVNITSISQSYRDLVALIHLPAVSGAGIFGLRWNGQTGATYTNISTQVSGTTVTSTGASTSAYHVICGTAPTAANNGFVEIRIPDYTQATTVKLMRSSYVNGGTGISTVITEGAFRGTPAATTSLTIYTSASLFTGGTVYVYGVK